MAIVMLSTTVMIEVAETYDEVRDLMDGPDVIELHGMDDTIVALRNPEIVATSATVDALRPIFARPAPVTPEQT